MADAPKNGGSGRYAFGLYILIILVIVLASGSLFLATGGSVLGRSSGVFGISETPELDAILKRSRQAAWSGSYDSAVAGFDTVVAARPQDRELAIERARVLGWAQRYDEAAEALAEVEDTADTETTLEQARFLWWASRPLEADSLLGAMLERNPELEEARELQDLVRPSIEPDTAVARRWVSERPRDPFARLWLARALVEAGRPAASLENYRVAMTESGAVEPDVLMEAAGVALGVDSLQYAGELLLRYLHDVDPEDLETRLRLARAYRWSGRWAEAEDQYRRVLEVVDNPDVMQELARMLASRGRDDAAIREYRRLLSVRPSLDARRELASALARDEQYGAAVEELDRVIRQKQDPDTDLLLQKAEVLSLMDRYSEAADVLARVLSRQPHAQELRLRRARLLWWSGRLEEADSELTTLLAAHPDHEEASRLREDVRKGIDATVDNARHWVELDATPANRLHLVRILTARDRHAEAVPQYRSILEDTLPRELVVEAVDLAVAADSLDAAIAILEDYLAESGPDRELLLRLARLHGWADRPAVAADVFGRYLEQYGEDHEVRFERAQQLAWQDESRWGEAQAELEQVLAADPRHAGALKLLGDLHRWQGEPEQALTYYRRAEREDPDLEGLQEGMQLATEMTEDVAPQDATHVAWAAELAGYTDSEDFDWLAVEASRNWKAGQRTTVRLGIVQQYARGRDLSGQSDGSLGLGARVVAGHQLTPKILTEVMMGVTSYGDAATFVTGSARLEYSDTTTVLGLQYERLPGVRDASTVAALHAETILHRLLLSALYGFGDWQAYTNLQLQAFRAEPGNVTRYAGTVRLDRAVWPGLRLGAQVRGIFATELSPVDPTWGPLLWTPVRYVAPALSLSYGTPLGPGWWLGLRASPGYAFIEERNQGITRYTSEETAFLEAGATLGYRSGPWSLSVSGDWGGALSDNGYHASALRIQVSRLAGAP